MKLCAITGSRPNDVASPGAYMQVSCGDAYRKAQPQAGEGGGGASVGGFGATCTCPSGNSYPVGGRGGKCGSPACYDGVASNECLEGDAYDGQLIWDYLTWVMRPYVLYGLNI